MSKTRGIVFESEVSRDVEPGVVTLYDRSRFQNNGAMTDVSWTQLPSGLWVMSYNGSSSLVDLGNADSLKLKDTNFTLMLWFNPTTVGVDTTTQLFGTQDSYYQLVWHNAGLVRFRIFDGGTNNLNGAFPTIKA